MRLYLIDATVKPDSIISLLQESQDAWMSYRFITPKIQLATLFSHPFIDI